MLEPCRAQDAQCIAHVDQLRVAETCIIPVASVVVALTGQACTLSSQSRAPPHCGRANLHLTLRRVGLHGDGGLTCVVHLQGLKIGTPVHKAPEALEIKLGTYTVPYKSRT